MNERQDSLESQLSELSELLLSNETLDTALSHVADIAVRAIPACDAAGVSLLEDGQVSTAATSGPLVQRVETANEHVRPVERMPAAPGELGVDIGAQG